MKESIGSTASLNIAFTFLAIIFAFLAGTLSYYKSFKVNNIIKNSIEKYEGLNDLSISEINSKLSSMGYQKIQISCGVSRKFNDANFDLDSKSSSIDGVCIFYYNDSVKNLYQYGITTYMTLNIPILSELFKIPVNTTTDPIYRCYGFNCES